MRAIWKGALSFGLLNVPVKLGTATSRKTISFNNLHRECHTPIKMKRYCHHCQREVEYEELCRGYEYEDKSYVIITEENLEELPVKSKKTIDILDFISLEEIDPVYYDKSYYLTPQEGAEKPYYLLKKTMESRGRVAVTKITIRKKESLAIIRTLEHLLLLETMFYPEEVREIEEPGLDESKYSGMVSEKEMEMAQELLDNLTSEFQPDKYRDRYREAMMEIIRKKIEGQEVEFPSPAPSQEGKVVNIMEKLKASVEESKRERRID